MKAKYTLLSILLLFSAVTQAQQPITITEDTLKYGKSLMPALSVTIPEANYENTLKAWTKTLESGTKSKVMSESGEMSIFGAKIRDLASNPLNIYSALVDQDSMLMLSAAFELKRDYFIERANGETDLSNARNFLKEFARNQYTDVAKDQLSAEEKKLRDLEKELSALEKEKNKYQKSIQSKISDITSAKGTIVVLNNELDKISAEIVDRNRELGSISDKELRKAKSFEIKDLEKRKKKALKSIESCENKINKSNNQIEKANLDIPENEKMQTEVRQKISDQQAICQSFEDKLNTIKEY